MILQNLAAMHFVAETGIDTFAPTVLSNHMGEQMWKEALGLLSAFTI